MYKKTAILMVACFLLLVRCFAQIPNIIVMIADDISVEDLGCYGHQVIKTPNIDALAQGGIKFNNAYLTTSSCSPSRVSILTGRYPHNTGAPELHNPLPENQILMPGILKNKGYYTAQAGKWHIGESAMEPAGPALVVFDRTGGNKTDGGGPSGAEMWVQYLQDRPKDQPFFMWFAAHDAHRPWDDKLFLQTYSVSDVILPDYLVADSATKEDLVAFYNEVSRFDFFVGEVVSELKHQSVLDNTIIIIMADNGRPFPRDKTALTPAGIKTPLIIYWPDKIASGMESESLISIIDLAPTILDAAGLEVAKSFQGRSFLNVLKSPETVFRNYAFAEHNWHDFMAYERMVTTGSYMYIQNGLPHLDKQGAIDIMGGGAGQSLKEGWAKSTINQFQAQIFSANQPIEELYDLSKDPLCLNNLVNVQSYEKTKKRLKRALIKWKKQTGDYQPEILTPDWYSREDLRALEVKGTRGELPGKSKKASTIHNSGPF